MSTTPSLIRPALGEAASLGALYDARTDTFLPLSACQAQPLRSHITKTDIHDSTIQYSLNDTLKEKFDNLDIKAHLGASFMAGLVKVEGSGKYLATKRDSNLVVSQSLLYNCTTASEKLELQGIENILSWPALESGAATHIVVEIIWGSRSVVMAKQIVSQSNNVKGGADSHLVGQLKLWEKFNLSGNADGDTANHELSLDGSVEVTVFGDVLADDGLIPTDLTSAFRFLSNVPMYIKSANGGKGKPLTYKLMPISLLSSVISRKISVPVAISDVESGCFESFVRIFDEITATRQELNDYHSLLRQNRDYVPQDHIRSVGDCIGEARNFEASLQARYATVLNGVRSGTEDKSALWSLLREDSNSDIKIRQLSGIISRNYKEKIQFLNGLIAQGAKYIGFNGESLDLELCSRPDTNIYVLHFSETAKSHSELWKQNLAILYQLFNETTHPLIILKDHDAVDEKLDAPKIVLVRNAECVIPDILQDRKIASNKSFARYNESHLERGNPKPTRRILMSLPCPNIDCGATTTRTWHCTRCGAEVEYGHIDDYLYCDCGRSLYIHWDFRCSNPNHGLNFRMYDEDDLLRVLRSLEPFEELNILILGQTGVGKSTWINAFVNYLSFPSLDDAMDAEELCWLIPFAFSTYNTKENGEFEKIKVSFGLQNQPAKGPVPQQVNISETDGCTGESATQIATVHRVQVEGRLVRLIDTPGIGDTRGASQDRTNMADILDVLRTYDKLHGILILLKPNEQRLGVMLRFCIQELLSHLHRDAARNIAFGFTNTRGTSYTPGDTFDPLQAQLNKFKDIDIGLRLRNVYCFDSESFRYLAAQKQHGKALGHLEENQKSWEYSVAESKRLLEHFKSIQPHQVTSTVNLHETRYRISQMTNPMADIVERINYTIMVNEDQIKELMQNDLKKKDLEDRLRIQIKTLTTVAVDSPRTACAHADCVKYSHTGLIGTDGVPQLGIVYETICHSPCLLTNIEVDQVGSAGLKNCWAMNGTDNCRVCGHPWNVHLHIKYAYTDGAMEIDDPMVSEALKRNANDREMKEAAIASKKKAIKEFEFELKTIRDAVAKFSIFLEKKRHRAN